MIDDTQYAAWLVSPSAIRCLLAEVVVNISGTETTIYLATSAYVTGPAETPANQYYAPCLSKKLTVTETLVLEGDSTGLAIGDIEIDNTGGLYDVMLTYVWKNRANKLYHGDPSWARSDFRLVLDGITDDMTPKSRNALGVKFRDKLQQLNVEMSTAKLGGTSTNKDTLLPNAMGEVFNMTPLLDSGVTFWAHNGAMEGVLEVRDEGLPVNFSQNVATGQFTLVRSPAGTITCDVQGDKPSGVYSNTVTSLIKRLVKGYGPVASRFTDSDLDLTQLAAFDTANPQTVGFPTSDRVNVLNACKDLANSVGAQLSMSRAGKLRLLRIQAPGTSIRSIGPYQMVEQDITPTTRPPVVAAVQLGFNKNWTVQEGLTTSMPAIDLTEYATEWTTSTQTDSTTATLYKISTEPVQQDTMLLKRTDADAEATRRLNIWKVQKQVYQFTAYAEMFDLQLGDTVTVTHPRFGLSGGVLALVVSLSISWANNRVVVGVLV